MITILFGQLLFSTHNLVFNVIYFILKPEHNRIN
jgi:hypothetical protein